MVYIFKRCKKSQNVSLFPESSDFFFEREKKYVSNETRKTSLKIFKHYKLKPSFSIIKDEKAKDKVGVGNKPLPPSFNNLIMLDPI